MEYTEPNNYIVVMFSGGLDSTYLVYKLLKEREDIIIHLHHVQMRKCGQAQNHWRAENLAVPKLVKWFKHEFPNKHIEFTTSRFEYFNQFWQGWDTTYYTILGIEVAKSIYAQDAPANIEIALGIENCLFRDPLIPVRAEEYKAVFEAITCRMLNKPTFIKPIVHMTKADIIKECPPELRAMTWSCRTPQKVGGEFIQCGRCHSCIELAFADGRIRELNRIPGGI